MRWVTFGAIAACALAGAAAACGTQIDTSVVDGPADGGSSSGVTVLPDGAVLLPDGAISTSGGPPDGGADGDPPPTCVGEREVLADTFGDGWNPATKGWEQNGEVQPLTLNTGVRCISSGGSEVYLERGLRFCSSASFTIKLRTETNTPVKVLALLFGPADAPSGELTVRYDAFSDSDGKWQIARVTAPASASVAVVGPSPLPTGSDVVLKLIVSPDGAVRIAFGADDPASKSPALVGTNSPLGFQSFRVGALWSGSNSTVLLREVSVVTD